MAIGNAIGGGMVAPDTRQQQIASGIDHLEKRLVDVEEFIKYAADISPEFEKLLTGYRARKRIGL